MRAKFDEQLNQLNQEMVQMGVMIEENIQTSIEALVRHNVEMAKEIVEKDVAVDQKQKQIEGICFDLLIQQQPVAKDLRAITAAMKMVTDMERIGDHASDIAEMTIFMGKSRYEANLEHINKMASETVLMLNWSIEAYIEKDKVKAENVIAHDDIVDTLFDETKNDIIKLIQDKSEDGEEATDLLMVAKYFERIGDHATNISEWVLYSLKTSADEEF